MRQGMASLQTTGARLLSFSRPHFPERCWAGALGRAGHADEALRVLDEALATAGSTGGRYYPLSPSSQSDQFDCAGPLPHLSCTRRDRAYR